MNPPLTEKKCVPCEGGAPPLNKEDAENLRQHTPNWTIDAVGEKIFRTLQFQNFVASMTFVNAVATLAEEEHHHPDLHLDSYRNVTVILSTHAVGGLSENDFILAAKIDALPEGKKATATEAHAFLA